MASALLKKIENASKLQFQPILEDHDGTSENDYGKNVSLQAKSPHGS